MTEVRREDFRSLGLNYSIDLRQKSALPEDVQKAIEGIPDAELESLARGDHVISGAEEFGALYDKLVELEKKKAPLPPGARAQDVTLDRPRAFLEAFARRAKGQKPVAPAPAPTSRGYAGAGLRQTPSYVVEQRPTNRVQNTAPALAARQAFAQKTFDNLKAAGLLSGTGKLDAPLPKELADRFRQDFPAQARNREPTYRDLFVALSDDHDANGTVDIKVDDCLSYGLFGQPPTLTRTEAAAVLLGSSGRGLALTDASPAITNPDVVRASVLLRRGAPGIAAFQKEIEDEPTRMAVLAQVAMGPDLDAAVNATRLLNQLSVHPKAQLRELAVQALETLPIATPRGQAEHTLDAIGQSRGAIDTRAAEAKTTAGKTIDTVYGTDKQRGIRGNLQGAARIPEVASTIVKTADEVRAELRENEVQIRRLETILGKIDALDGRKKSLATELAGLRENKAGTEILLKRIEERGRSFPPGSAERTAMQSEAAILKTQLADMDAKISGLVAEDAELDRQLAVKPRVQAELRGLHEQRAKLLVNAADVALKLERAAWGLADDSGWTRASYASNDRRAALDAAGRLLAEVRTQTQAEIDGQMMATGADPVSLDTLRARIPLLEKGMVDNKAHLRAFGLQYQAAVGNDAFRLKTLESTRLTVGLLMSSFPSDLEVAKRAAEGDPEAIAQVAADRKKELAAFGLDADNLPEGMKGKSTVEILAMLAKTDSTARARLSLLQRQLGDAVHLSGELLAKGRATPEQLAAMETLERMVRKYEFNSESLESFDVKALEAEFDKQLKAAGLYGITPKSEIDRMKEIGDQAKRFTLLTDLAAGVIDRPGEPTRDELSARRLAADQAMRDPAHAYAVTREMNKGQVVYRVRKLDGNDAAAYRKLTEMAGRDRDEQAAPAGPRQDTGFVYIAKREGADLKETDRYTAYTDRPEVAALFRPYSEGGQKTSAFIDPSVQSELYGTMYDRASKQVADRYKTAILALDRFHVGTPPDRAAFRRDFGALVTKLKTTKFEAATTDPQDGRPPQPTGRLRLEQTIMALGKPRAEAIKLAGLLWEGKDSYTERTVAWGSTTGVGASVKIDITDDLFSSAVQARARYQERLTEVSKPFMSTWHPTVLGNVVKPQVFRLYSEFPDLATDFYRRSGFNAIEGFPPRLKPGMKPGSEAERLFLDDAGAWKDHEEMVGYLNTGALIGAAILLTVGTGGALGPEAAMLAGVAFAATTSGYEIAQAAGALQKAQDARAVGAGSDATVRFHENELTGAYGAFVINVATAGLAAKFGGGQLASAGAKALVRRVVKEAVVGVVVGAGAGALTAAVNPNTYQSGNTLGVILKGAVVGGVGGGAGAVAGTAAGAAFASPVGKRVGVAFTKTPGAPKLEVGAQVHVTIEGQNTPQKWKVSSIDEGRGRMVIERDGQKLTLDIREAQALTVDENNPAAKDLARVAAEPEGAVAAPESPTAPGPKPVIVDAPSPPGAASGTPASGRPGAPRPAPRETVPANELPSKPFAERLGTDHPLLADQLGRVSGPNADAIRLRAMGAAERNPTIRRFIETDGPEAARLVGELGEAKFLAAFGDGAFSSSRIAELLSMPGRRAELVDLAKKNPAAVQKLMEGMGGEHRTAVAEVARNVGLEPAAKLADVSASSPNGLSYLLDQPGGRAQVQQLLATGQGEALVARASHLEGRVFMRASDGTWLLRGEAPKPAPIPDRAALEAVCKRAGVDPSVLDNPTAHPREIKKLMEQMRSELPPAQRAALDREISGRRFVDQQHYEEAQQAGVDHPENRYGRRDYQNWLRAQRELMEAARAGKPITVEMLQRAHAIASEGMLRPEARGQLRSAPNQRVYQGGEGPMGIQEVTAQELAGLRANPDLEVADLGATEGGKHRVIVGYASPDKVLVRMKQIVDRVNQRLAAGEDPVKVAADAQREMVSVHPFMDGNGRTSRLLMDYVMARAGMPETVVSDPNLDTALTPDQWQGEVRAGMKRPFQSTLDAWARMKSSSGSGGPLPTEAQHRQGSWVDRFKRGGPGRNDSDGRALFEAAGGMQDGQIPGFARVEDMAPTIDRAAGRVRDTGEPAMAVRVSLRNLGGVNNKLGHEGADAVLAEYANIAKEELGKTGATVNAFTDGPDTTFVLSGKEVPPGAVDAALLRAQSRIAARAKQQGLSGVDHPKHPGDPAWRGVGISTSTVRIGPRDDAASVNRALSLGIARYNAGLGQAPPAPPPAATPIVTRPAPPPGGAPAPVPPRRSPGAPSFVSEAQFREQNVRAEAKRLGLKEGEVQDVLQAAGNDLKHPVTGFEPRADRLPTMKRAIDFAKKTGERVYYVEIDVRNLGGLNKAVGMDAANADMKVMAGIIREEMAAVGADVVCGQHGGDEMHVIAVGPGATKQAIEARMAIAQQRIAEYARARGIDGVPHTKAGKAPGVGILFAVEEATPGMTPGEVFHNAGERVEALKQAK